MNPEEFRKALANEGLHLTDIQMQQFNRYYELLVEWNQKINLTAITERHDVYLKHFYDSITLGLQTQLLEGEPTLCDVGAGAGFPSIPLKIAYPQIKVTIVDSLNKRIQFLERLFEELELEGVHCYHDRAETFGQNTLQRETYDLVTARAVARMSVLSELCIPLVKQGGYFVAMKAASSEEELQDAKVAIATLGAKIEKDVSFELPNNEGERHLILIHKTKKTPKKYPRKPGTPNKSPL